LLIIPVVMFWFFRNGASSVEQRNALGWHSGKGVLREIGAGIAGYLAGIVVMIAGFLVTYLLVKRTGISPEHPLIHILQGNIWHVLGLYALVSVFAPLMEETMFRGALFHHLRGRWGWAISAPIVAFIFAVIHPQGWVAVPVLGSIAIVLAALREWRGSLIAPMVAHACNNFIVLTFALAVLR
jgi:membrane protease YdiL (CAAX protease family)